MIMTTIIGTTTDIIYFDIVIRNFLTTFHVPLEIFSHLPGSLVLKLLASLIVQSPVYSITESQPFLCFIFSIDIMSNSPTVADIKSII